MKGFVHMIEVAISAMLIVLAFTVFVGIHKAGLSWERPDLIALGGNILGNLQQSGKLAGIISDASVFDNIEAMKPANVRYGIRISGAPAQNISVGCNCTPAGLAWARQMLTPSYVNGRWVNFSVSMAGPQDYDRYDRLLFVNFTDFDKQNWGDRNMVAVADISDVSQLDGTFGLSNSGKTGSLVAFQKYEKYWFGFGLEALATGSTGGKPSGQWTLWEAQRSFNISGNAIEITGVGKKSAGESFSLTGPDGKSYYFKVKDVLGDRAFIQPMNYSFPFMSFSDDKVTGDCVVGNATQGFCAEARNSSRTWLSYFPYSSEYQSLLKSALAQGSEWWLVPAEQQGVEVRGFATATKDMPETFVVKLILWYAY